MQCPITQVGVVCVDVDVDVDVLVAELALFARFRTKCTKTWARIAITTPTRA